MTSEELTALVESIGPEQIGEWETGVDTILSLAFHKMCENKAQLKGILGACVNSATSDHDLFVKVLFMGWIMGWKTSEKIIEAGMLEKLTKLE